MRELINQLFQKTIGLLGVTKIIRRRFREIWCLSPGLTEDCMIEGEQEVRCLCLQGSSHSWYPEQYPRLDTSYRNGVLLSVLPLLSQSSLRWDVQARILPHVTLLECLVHGPVLVIQSKFVTKSIYLKVKIYRRAGQYYQFTQPVILK